MHMLVLEIPASAEEFVSDVASIEGTEIIRREQFEGSGEIVQIAVVVAPSAYLTLSRILTFVERMCDKPARECPFRVSYRGVVRLSDSMDASRLREEIDRLRNEVFPGGPTG